MKAKPSTRLINALAARTHFGEIMEEVERNQVRFVVSRRGRPTMIMLSVRDYLRNIVKKSELLADIQLEAQTAGMETITDDDIDQEIKAYRQAKQ
jgi:prevent-host-death family protein